jgi:hypothetical protein
MVITTFITKLIIVGVVTYTVEIESMGKKAKLVRNIIRLITAAIVTLASVVFCGKVF